MSHPSHHHGIQTHFSKRQINKTVDTMAYVVGIAGNLAVIPQLIKAWQSSAPGMSVLTWVFFILTASVWLVYGIRHKQKPLIVSTSASILFNILIVAGWLYNNKIK